MQVLKDLSPEIKTALGNIMSLCQQIQGNASAEDGAGSGQGGQGPATDEILQAYAAMKEAEAGRQEAPPEGVTKPVENETEESKTAKAIKSMSPAARKALAKALQASDPDASTASDTAETRIDDQPEDNADLSEVEKTLVRGLIALNARVTKSATPASPVDPQMAAIATIAKSLEVVLKNQQRQDFIFGELLEGLGVAKAFAPEGGQSPTKVEKAAIPLAGMPGMGLDINQLIKTLVEANVQKSGGSNNYQGDSRGNQIRNDLGEVAKALFGQPVAHQ